MKMRYALAAAAVLAVAAQPVDAQVRFGPQVSYADDFDLGVGARAEFGLGGLFGAEGPLSTLTGAASFDYFFPDCGDSDDFDCTYFEINGNLLYPVALGENVAPYVGAGINFARFSTEFEGPGGADFSGSSSDVGLNILGGLKFGVAGFSAGAEGRLELGGGEQLVIAGYVLFGGR